jgi:hypothetical protein
MAFIKTISPGRASGEAAEVYDYMAEVSGNRMVAKIVQIFSLRPASMRRMIRQWELTMCGQRTQTTSRIGCRGSVAFQQLSLLN